MIRFLGSVDRMVSTARGQVAQGLRSRDRKKVQNSWAIPRIFSALRPRPWAAWLMLATKPLGQQSLGFLIVCIFSQFTFAEGPAPSKKRLSDQLTAIRAQVLSLEKSLIDSLQTKKKAEASIRGLQKLIVLQRQERELGKRRSDELELTIRELESRREVLGSKIQEQQRILHGFLTAIESSIKSNSFHLPEAEKVEAPRRRVLANLASRSLKEIEILKVDLSDADHLEGRIQDEKQQLAYLFQDLNEQEGLLELNRNLQADILQKKHQERIAQLGHYRRLKSSEAQVETLIEEFNARRELERTEETERVASKAMMQGIFTRLKGKLPWPVKKGRALSSFGRVFDPKSSLYIFKKGIDISAGTREKVRAISAGKVVYSGELPDYGQIAIIDHGDHYYSLCGHLGELNKKAGDSVASGDVIGLTDDSGTPVYFEIRARNVAVNPLQWVNASSNFSSRN